MFYCDISWSYSLILFTEAAESVLHIKISSHSAEPLKLLFHMGPPEHEGTKFYRNFPGHFVRICDHIHI